MQMENKWEQYWGMMVILKTGINQRSETSKHGHDEEGDYSLNIEGKNMSPDC